MHKQLQTEGLPVRLHISPDSHLKKLQYLNPLLMCYWHMYECLIRTLSAPSTFYSSRLGWLTHFAVSDKRRAAMITGDVTGLFKLADSWTITKQNEVKATWKCSSSSVSSGVSWPVDAVPKSSLRLFWSSSDRSGLGGNWNQHILQWTVHVLFTSQVSLGAVG